jgi:hypothetical protein
LELKYVKAFALWRCSRKMFFVLWTAKSALFERLLGKLYCEQVTQTEWLFSREKCFKRHTWISMRMQLCLRSLSIVSLNSNLETCKTHIVSLPWSLHLSSFVWNSWYHSRHGRFTIKDNSKHSGFATATNRLT